MSDKISLIGKTVRVTNDLTSFEGTVMAEGTEYGMEFLKVKAKASSNNNDNRVREEWFTVFPSVEKVEVL